MCVVPKISTDGPQHTVYRGFSLLLRSRACQGSKRREGCRGTPPAIQKSIRMQAFGIRRPLWRSGANNITHWTKKQKYPCVAPSKSAMTLTFLPVPESRRLTPTVYSYSLNVRHPLGASISRTLRVDARATPPPGIDCSPLAATIHGVCTG